DKEQNGKVNEMFSASVVFDASRRAGARPATIFQRDRRLFRALRSQRRPLCALQRRAMPPPLQPFLNLQDSELAHRARNWRYQRRRFCNPLGPREAPAPGELEYRAVQTLGAGSQLAYGDQILGRLVLPRAGGARRGRANEAIPRKAWLRQP